jgi:phosphonate transport system substrate-binding protein
MNRRIAISQVGLSLGLLNPLRQSLAQYQAVNIGVLPHVNARVIATQYEPMQQFLSYKLDAKVMISSAPNWVDFYTNTKNGDYDITIASANVARLMQIDLGLTPVACFHPKIQGLIVTHKHFSHQSIESKFGTRIAMSNPASLVSMQAEEWLAKQGLKVGIDFQFMRVKGETSIGMMLAQKEATAGVMTSYGFQAQTTEVKSQLQIHKSFTDVPSFVILASRRFAGGLGRHLPEQFEEFSTVSREGKSFTERTGFKILNQVNDRDLVAMDTYLDKTKKLIS